MRAAREDECVRRLMMTGATVVWLGGCSASDSQPGQPGTPYTHAGTLASGIVISGVALYQGLEVSVMQSGQGLPAEQYGVPLIRGRGALLRVLVTPAPQWQPREVTAHLELESDSRPLPAQQITRLVQAPSSSEDLASSFNFEIANGDVGAELRYSIAIVELPGQSGPGTSEGALYPAAGKARLHTENTGEALKIVLVPIRYEADGSGRLPDTSPQRVQRFRDLVYSLYPVPDVEITLREAVPFTLALPGTDEVAWQTLLDQVRALRARDGVAPDVYYYGLVTPTADYYSYCSRGCFGGLTAIGGSGGDAVNRVSVGIGYADALGSSPAEQSLVHELGHAHGRLHSPCVPDGQLPPEYVDPRYPHPEARIGRLGYDLVEKRLVDPAGPARDLMGYCEPYFVSDYTYRALAQRIGAVSPLAYTPRERPRVWRSYLVTSEGVARGEALPLERTPTAELRDMLVTNAHGRRERVTGHFYQYDHLPGGLLLVREQ